MHMYTYLFGIVLVMLALMAIPHTLDTPATPLETHAPKTSATHESDRLQHSEEDRVATTTDTDTPSPLPSPTPTTTKEVEPSPVATTPPATQTDSGSFAVTVPTDPPYAHPPLASEKLNANARAALVNIFCKAHGSAEPISASGVIIDPRGIILTNAHVAQYFLLENSPRVDVSCGVRTGAPAISQWEAELVYLPPVWIAEHADAINEERPLGTGENDFALLRITHPINTTEKLPDVFPFVAPEVRPTISITGETVLAASYPAGFIGGALAHTALYPVSTITKVQDMYTFNEGSIDVLSLGGVIIAQGGSSGGAVVNPWGYLVGVIATARDADTTAERDVRAITIAHIDTVLHSLTGNGLSGVLASNIDAQAHSFNTRIAPGLTEQLLKAIEQN